jgi:hypothetical protein
MESFDTLATVSMYDRMATCGTLRTNCGTGPAITIVNKTASGHMLERATMFKTIMAANEVNVY